MSAIITPQLQNWAQHAVGQIGRRLEGFTTTKRKRKLCVVHLDGVPKRLLDEAVLTGQMPFLSRLVRSGAYHLDTAFWGSPASTPCFQAGLLYGLRHPNLPAYNWFDRELGRQVRMNAPKDTLAIEQRLGNFARNSLLEDGGTAYLSLFRAGAENRLCMSALANLKAVLKSAPAAFRNIRAAPRQSVATYVRTVARELWDTWKDVRRWVREVKDWRHEREFMLNRFFLVSLGWNLARTRAEIDMVAGVPAIYLVYGNYDEVSHRRGPFSPQAIRELHRVDGALEELYAIGKSVAEPYDIYLLTDHGHVDSAPFEKRQHVRLQPYLMAGPPVPLEPAVERALLDGRLLQKVPPQAPDHEPVVIEAGNFSHVYLTRDRRALEAKELLEWHRDVVARAVAHPDIGIVAMRRGDSAVAVVGNGVYGPDEIEKAPLPAEFNKRAVADLLRELPHMPTAGDLVLYGQSVTQTGTVGFAWEFGSHGGLTRIETDSVICWPADAPLNLSGLGHSVQLHEKLSEVYRS
ncbi:MAG TPA: alkaline phosphatase family protein [Myxococcaceae bacterium]|nr:alkaline phosphatase family protein [Myxococcaceae bacterium]